MDIARRASGSGQSLRRSILKQEAFIDVRDDLDHAMALTSSEMPEHWFQRILASHSLSPLDLCDRFSYGNAGRHRHVSIKHVCEVLFELEAPGCDPMSDAMEEFLYRFSFDGGDGEIVVNIKEALRTLDIWKTTGPVSPSKQLLQISSPQTTVSPAKAAILEVKADKLKQVIDSLQQENLRLSRALLSTKGGADTMDESRPPSPLRIAVKNVAGSASFPSSSQRPSSPSRPSQQTPPSVVSRHERELIALANRLEYSGVKKLEALLHKHDDTSNGGGFVSLKQLRWLLGSECELGNDVSELKLMELCLGMNFNAQGQLEYAEFVRVLLDILIYESRPSRASCSSNSGDQQAPKRPGLSEADETLLTKTREYLRGLYGTHATIRALLDTLCDKYDLEGNQTLSLAEMTRAFQIDLASQHPVRLQIPLTQSETRRLLLALAEISGRPIVNKPQGDHSDAVFVFYPAILDAIFRFDPHIRNETETETLLTRVLSPAFWQALRSALCPHEHNATMTRKIHAQVCKILLKLDPKQTFQIALRHFVRVFDQHWNARDLDVVAEVLSHPLAARPSPDGVSGSVWVRYDVLMRLLFGAPELRDVSALQGVITALRRNSAGWQEELSELANASGSLGKKLTFHHVYELLRGQDTSMPINLTEFLYLVAHVHDDSHRVEAHNLWTLLTQDTSSPTNKTQATSSSADTQSFTVLQRCLRVLLNDHGLDKVIARRCRHERGVVRVDDLAQQLYGQLRTLRLSPQERDQVSMDQIHGFVDSLTRSTDNASPGRDLLYTHAFMDAVFDWDNFTSALRLPDRLGDVKKTLELFDWDKDDSIDAEDWTKAWRQLTIRTRAEKQQSPTPQALHDWEICVLVRRFPAAPSETRSRRSTIGFGAIAYSRLLVFLLDRQQRVARDQLQDAVLLLLQQLRERVTQGKRHSTTFHLETAFEAIDRDGKGYFHSGDLRQFVLDQLDEMRGEKSGEMDVQTLQTYANQGPALEAVMAFLIGDKDARNHKQVVSLMRFQELWTHGFGQPELNGQRRRSRHRSRSRSKTRRSSRDDEDDTSSAEDESSEFDPRGRASSPQRQRQITLLRDLELCVFEISKPFVDAQGQTSPAAAYKHLLGSPTTQQPRRPRSQSPVRSFSKPPVAFSASSSCSSSRRASCCSTPRTIAEATRVEPLTASRLKLTLRDVHGVETSTHLISQFFLRLGAPTKHFLDLVQFAKWLAPLSLDLQARVKQIVNEMLVKSKGGGGHVDLERFIGAVERRLADAQASEDAMAGRQIEDSVGRPVRPAVLLTRLHQLNVSLRKWELVQLLRHFGMDDHREIDSGALLRKIYELGQQLPVHGDR